jgi:5-methylcytosine-specific restriction endonuclease McrA
VSTEDAEKAATMAIAEAKRREADVRSRLCKLIYEASEAGLSKREQLGLWAGNLADHPGELHEVWGELIRMKTVVDGLLHGVYYTWERDRLKAGDGKQPAYILRRELIAEAGKCRVCGSTGYLEVDHVVPVSRGGGRERSNLQVLCRGCNGKKKTKTMTEWLGEGWEARLL